MSANRTIVATLVGALVLYLTGYLLFVVILGDFYAANAGTATGVDREVVRQWPLLVGALANAVLIVYAAGSRLPTMSVRGGVVCGAVVGFLLWASVDFIFYGATNLSNLTLTVFDPFMELLHGAVGGGTIALVSGWGRGPGPASA